MDTQDKFPLSLLKCSTEIRKEYFYGKTINHPRLHKAKESTLSLIDNIGEPDIMIVTGPSGVGKTTLALKIEDELLKRNMPTIQSEKSHLPVIRFDAIAHDREKKFDWKDFYTRWLQAFNEPCISQKQLFEDDNYIWQPISPYFSKNTAPALRQSVENTMKHRGTRTVIIDEANHLLMVEPKDLSRQFEIIKSLSQSCNASIILIGTYDLLQILEQSAQLVRRALVVHMARYDDYIPADKLAFKNALYSFQRHMPFKIEPNLLPYLDFFYLKSAGCIGILKKWLNTVVKVGLEEGLETVDWDFILKYAHSNKRIQTVLREAFIGETKLKDIDVKELRRMLREQHKNIEKSSTKIPNALQASSEGEQESLPKLPPDKKSVKGQVGKRKPNRDPVGANCDSLF